jgi:hypothetical protein
LSNYYVTTVHYDIDRNVIAKLTGINPSIARQDFEFSRSEVIEKINSGLIFYTFIKNEKGEYIPGEKIDVYTVNGTEWLKTKKNDTEKDNLEMLPEY